MSTSVQERALQALIFLQAYIYDYNFSDGLKVGGVRD